MATHQPMENLYLVDLNQPLEGFYNFLSSWIYRRDGFTIVVDPGPRSTIPVLLEALKRQNINKLDYILLTHIHIDHAGGVGIMIEQFPDVKVICHHKGISHMVDPAKLWEGSRKVLGNVAEIYGKIAAIPEKNLSYQDSIELGSAVIKVFETPGHAVHHLSYQIDDLLFLGEVAGINYPSDDGLYLRLATPMPFIYEVYRSSLEKAASIDVSHLCFGHYGYRQDVKKVFDTALNQLNYWMATVEKHYRLKSEPLEETIYEELLKNDCALSLYHTLPIEVQSREKFFSFNSIRGMLDYLKKRDSKI